MAQAKSSPAKPSRRPEVSTYADHEVINPPNELRKAISKIKIDIPGDDPVARAEQALSLLATEFTDWMDEESERLDTARKQLKSKGINKADLEALYHAAHDIKGEAATFGYPLAAPAAESLCRIVEQTPNPSRIPLALVDQHVSAVRAIIREYARPDIEMMATDLVSRLRDVSEEFLTAENKDRLAPLEGVQGPSLVPGE
jgi:chemotaxis protein histidine kinase CheA